MNNWTKLNIYSKYPGRFFIYINKNKTIIYKKNKKNSLGNKLLRRLKDKKKYMEYKNILENTIHHPYIGKYTISGYDIELDGSYKSKYINGHRLDKINNDISDIVLNKIAIQIQKLKNDLNKANVDYSFGGDWALHNLIYSLENDIIYNIDLEGFFTDKVLPKWGNINKINAWLDNIILKYTQKKY